MNKKTILGGIMSILALFGFSYFSEETNLGIAIPTIVATYEDNLQSKITDNATTMTLVRGTDDTGTALSGYYGFVIDEGSSNEEFVTCMASSTALTNCTRGLSLTDGKTSVTALKKAHRKGASVKITNYPQLAILSRIVNGQEGFPNKLYFDTNIDYTSASSSWIVDKNYADNLAISGSPLATTILQGIVQLGTTSDWGTATGTTGAWLVPTMSLATSTPTANNIVVADGTGRINTGWLSDLNFTWTGTHTFSATTTITKTPTDPNDVVNKNYVDNFFNFGYLTASDNLMASSNSEYSTSSTSYVKVKEIRVNRPGTIRVKYEIKSSSGSSDAFGKIYVNSTSTTEFYPHQAIGYEYNNNNTTYATSTATSIRVNAGDLVQLYIKSGGGSYTTSIRNFGLYYDIVTSTAEYIVNTIY